MPTEGPSTVIGDNGGVPDSVRDRMVEAAWLLIAERGLEGMSTREVLARTGAPRGSVYHHFPRGRTELIEHAIDHSRRWMHDQIATIHATHPDDLVTGYLDIWRRVVEGTGFRAGCAVTGVVIGGHDSDLLDRAAAAFQATIDTLAERFQQLGMIAPDALRRATMLVTAAEGAVVVARARRTVEPLTLLAEQLTDPTSAHSH